MPNCGVDGLTFEFPDGWLVAKYDDWSYYRNRFAMIQDGVKALDILALSPEGVVWLIEVKDYSRHVRTKPSELDDEVARKVLDTLAALLPAKLNGDVHEETRMAQLMLRAKGLRMVLHLETQTAGSNLTRHSIDPSNIQMKLRKRLKWIDPHPVVANSAQMNNLPWTVHRAGQTH